MHPKQPKALITPMTQPRHYDLNHTSIWAKLHQHQRATRHMHMRELFAADPQRFQRFSLSLGPLLMDYSKHRITERTLELLFELADAAHLKDWRQRMRAGEAINVSEKRAVLHMALRGQAGDDFQVDGQPVMAQVLAVRARMAAFAEQVRSGAWLGFDGRPIRAVVNLGIGGSDLGPLLACRALRPYAAAQLDMRFVANLDGQHLAQALQGLEPATTLFIVASKSFTTPETLMNAEAARAWLLAAAPTEAVARHFVAISSQTERVRAFGIDPANMFEFWDWVGGRYSVWSAIGLSVMLSIGPAAFEDFLAGARRMDAHFLEAPFAQNIPVILALLGVWYNTFYRAHTHAIMPYDQGLARLPAYLQQLDMESNGKRVGRYGETLDFDTGPVIWGEVGVNSQHAFFQLLHQGTRLVPCDFIVPMRSHYPLDRHHEALVANCFAQTEALMRGKTEAEVLGELAGLDGDTLDMLLPQKLFPGNQPSTTLALDAITPHTLGMLLAMYEHKVFVQGVIWGINSFDQWGVEYGKQLARQIQPELADASAALAHDASTNALIAHYRARKTQP